MSFVADLFSVFFNTNPQVLPGLIFFLIFLSVASFMVSGDAKGVGRIFFETPNEHPFKLVVAGVLGVFFVVMAGFVTLNYWGSLSLLSTVDTALSLFAVLVFIALISVAIFHQAVFETLRGKKIRTIRSV